MSASTYSYLHDAWVANPFDSDAAKRHSSYSGFADGELSRLLETAPLGTFAHVAHDAFREWVLDPEFRAHRTVNRFCCEPSCNGGRVRDRHHMGIRPARLRTTLTAGN